MIFFSPFSQASRFLPGQCFSVCPTCLQVSGLFPLTIKPKGCCPPHCSSNVCMIQPQMIFSNFLQKWSRASWEIRLKSSLCWKFSRKGWTVFSVGCYFEWRQKDELNDLAMIPQPCDFVIILASSISFSPNTKIKSALRYESV